MPSRFGDRGPSRSLGHTYDDLVSDALCAPIEGWDFSWLTGRIDRDDLPWDYESLAREALTNATRLLDIDTGGGEVLASLAPLPPAIATEPYSPNVPIATARLAPLGVDVRAGRASALPVADEEVNLVLNRHGSLDATEAARVLIPGGVFLTQQVGSRNDLAFNDALGVLPHSPPDSHTLQSTVAKLEDAGLVIDQAQENYAVTRYLDVGAVVFQLRSVPWQVPGFDVATSAERLRRLDAHIRRTGSFDVKSHRFLVRAHRV
jgi:SAM-dependent methyltransferase